MSSGIIVPLTLGDKTRYIIPFIPFENESFVNNLRKRLIAASRARQENDILELIKIDPNYQLVAAVVHPLITHIQEHFGVDSNQAFEMAGDFWKTLQSAEKINEWIDLPYEVYLQDLERLLHLIKEYKIDPLTPGYEQYIARLNHLIQFEDKVVTFDNYALFLEDYEMEHNPS